MPNIQDCIQELMKLWIVSVFRTVVSVEDVNLLNVKKNGSFFNTETVGRNIRGTNHVRL